MPGPLGLHVPMGLADAFGGNISLPLSQEIPGFPDEVAGACPPAALGLRDKCLRTKRGRKHDRFSVQQERERSSRGTVSEALNRKQDFLSDNINI